MGDSQATYKSKPLESPEPSSGNRAALTPRVPIEDAWLVNTTGEDVACMTTNELVAALRAGEVVDHTFVWREGFNDWLRIVQIPGLKRLANGGIPRSNPFGVPRLHEPTINEMGEDFDAPTSITMIGADALRLLELKHRTSSADPQATPLAVYNKPLPTLAVAESVRSAWNAQEPEDEDLISETQLERAPVGAGMVPYGQYIGFEPTLPAAVMPPLTPRSSQPPSAPPSARKSLPPAPKSERPEAARESSILPAAAAPASANVARESTDPLVVMQIERARSSFIRATVGACIASAMLASGITVFFVRSARESESHAAAAKVMAPVAKPATPAETAPPVAAKPEPAPVAITTSADEQSEASAKPTKTKSESKRPRPRSIRPAIPAAVATPAPTAPASVQPGQDMAMAAAAPSASATATPSANSAETNTSALVARPSPATTTTARSSATQIPAPEVPSVQPNSSANSVSPTFSPVDGAPNAGQ
jgi:hypothetical protein